jgi:thiol-disulfide isomerase/thioredoxin
MRRPYAAPGRHLTRIIMNTRQLLAAACAASLGLGSAFAGGEGWTHDYEAAKKQAASEKKDLLLDFTGSDWCPPCMALTSKVFSQAEFRELTKDKFVLVELDFPKDKSKVSEETAKQNNDLQSKYAIEGYPTIFLCDASGRPFAKTGFKPGGPKEYAEHLDELRGKKESFDKTLAEAGKKDGPDKAKALIAALDSLEMGEGAIAEFYGEVVTQIKAADPKDETGYAKKMEESKKFAAFDKELRGFHEAEKPDWDAAMKFVEKTLADNTFEGEKKQMVLLAKVSILASTDKFDEAIKVVDEAKAAAPDSQLAPRLEGFKEQLEEAKNGPKEDEEKEEKAGE